jgi:hypothetical protein
MAALALLGASAAITAPVLAGADMAQAAVSPAISETVCGTVANTLNVFMNNSLGCVSFHLSGTADGLDLANTTRVNTGHWEGSFTYLQGSSEHTRSFTENQSIPLSNVIIITIHLS